MKVTTRIKGKWKLPETGSYVIGQRHSKDFFHPELFLSFHKPGSQAALLIP
jgi:hypothetical protein